MIINDVVFTEMPVSCIHWPCSNTPDKAVLENKNGFMVCPICQGSYGSLENTKAEK